VAAKPQVKRSANRQEAGIVILVMAALLYMFSQTVADPDLWGHVRFGLDFWQSGAIARTDPYSYLTQGQLWINHEWLAEAIFASLFTAFGSAGLAIFKTIVSLLIMGALYWRLHRIGAGYTRAGILLLLASLLIVPWLSSVRPQLFTFLLFTLLLLALDTAERGKSVWVWAAPPLIALWVNLHGGFLAGLVLFLVWAITRLGWVIWKERRAQALLARDRLHILLALLVTPLATFVNPYGAKLIGFLLQTATVKRPEIVEWQPTVILSPRGVVFALLVGLALLAVLQNQRERKPAMLAILACTAVMPFSASRHEPLFALAFLGVGAEYVLALSSHWLPDREARPAAGLFLALLGVGAALLVGLSIPRLGRIRLDARVLGYPARAVALLKASDIRANMAVHFGWGEYAIWHLGPQIQVSIDGRRETVYSEEIYAQNLRFMYGVDEWDALLRMHKTELVLISKRMTVFNLMKLLPDWVLVYEDPLCALFARRDSPLAAQIVRTPIPSISYNGNGLLFP
jgi:hypothetical protein